MPLVSAINSARSPPSSFSIMAPSPRCPPNSDQVLATSTMKLECVHMTIRSSRRSQVCSCFHGRSSGCWRDVCHPAASSRTALQKIVPPTPNGRHCPRRWGNALETIVARDRMQAGGGTAKSSSLHECTICLSPILSGVRFVCNCCLCRCRCIATCRSVTGFAMPRLESAGKSGRESSSVRATSLTAGRSFHHFHQHRSVARHAVSWAG